MHGMILTVLSSAAGSAAGCILSLYLGRPGKRAKTDPFSKRILPLCAGFLLFIWDAPAKEQRRIPFQRGSFPCVPVFF